MAKKTVYICGNKYRYEERKKVPDPSKKGKYIWGRANTKKKEIEIKSPNGQDKLQTQIHEFLHVICGEYTEHQPIYNLYRDETSIEILSKELTGIMRQLNLTQERKR